MAIESQSDERMESPQVSLRPLLFAALGVLMLLASAVGILEAIYHWQVPVKSYPAPEQFPQPRVQTGQVGQLHRLEAEQTQRLQQYKWVDRKQGLIQIPIDRAMQLLAGEGNQAYAPLISAQSLASPSAGAERLITPQAQPSPGGTPPNPQPSPQPSPGAAASPPSNPSVQSQPTPAPGGNATNIGSPSDTTGQRP